jgi:FkbM family methyltransferase
MQNTFSFSYIFKVARLFLRYPKALFTLANGPESVGSYINEIRKKRYAKNPIWEKRVYNYLIFLNPEDRDFISPAIGVDGLYEPEETELLRKIVRKGAVVVDVGANIGWYTLLSAHLAGKTGKIVAFEPEPSSFSLLKQSVKRNGFDNVFLFNNCVSNIEGERKLWLSKGNLGRHSIVSSAGTEAIDVEAVTLDICLSKLEIQIVDLLKIDVEGVEPEVLEGALNYLLSSKIKNIFLEWNCKAWANKEELLQKLLRKYTVYQIMRSPFLIKKQAEHSLTLTQSANLYLKLIE